MLTTRPAVETGFPSAGWRTVLKPRLALKFIGTVLTGNHILQIQLSLLFPPSFQVPCLVSEASMTFG